MAILDNVFESRADFWPTVREAAWTGLQIGLVAGAIIVQRHS